MKLYYAPLACSLAAHITAREAGLEVELVRVDLATKRTAQGGDLFIENPMGQVPTLVLDDGRTLTENVSVLSYLSDRAANGSDPSRADDAEADRYELVRWLSFVATELHKKVLWPVYAPQTPDAVKAFARQSAERALTTVNAHLESRETLSGGVFTGADAYLFWAATLLPLAGVSLEAFPAVARHQKHHRGRPAVHEALTYEKRQYEVPFAAA